MLRPTSRIHVLNCILVVFLAWLVAKGAGWTGLDVARASPQLFWGAVVAVSLWGLARCFDGRRHP